MTHNAHGAYGYAQLLSDSSVTLTELYYDGAGISYCLNYYVRKAIGVLARTKDQLDRGDQGDNWVGQQHCDHRQADRVWRGEL